MTSLIINVDLLALEKTIVKYYEMTMEESNGQLVFVLKLDECQLAKGMKLERVSITLVNRALQGRDVFQGEEGKDPKGGQGEHFSVQSEKNIWWLAAFQVRWDVLEWYFNASGLKNVINGQYEGEELEVEGMGSFKVEWHLACDLKTLKCMYGCKHGANTKFPCIYCCHSRGQPARV